MKSNISRNKKFFNKLAKYYDKGFFNKWLNGILKKALRDIEIKSSSKVLDAGCGTGNLLLLLSQKNKKLKLYGIDISENMLDLARRKLGNKAILKMQEAESLKEKSYFDYIFSTEAFHHYDNQEKVMENFYRSLKKNGKLIIVDLSFGKALNWLFNKIEPGNSKMNSSKDFYLLFEKYWFKNIEQKRLGIFTIMTKGKK